ncbi:hypothetical protein Tco_1417703 [Tanacetum coccineum]
MPCSCDRRGMWDRRENVIIALVMKWLGTFKLCGVAYQLSYSEAAYLCLEYHLKQRKIGASIGNLATQTMMYAMEEIHQLTKYGKICKMTKERILKDHWRDRIGDKEDDLKENLEDPKECREDKANTIMGAIHNNLNEDWFNNTSEDEDDLEGILDYLEPRSYDGFINLDDEDYNKRRCKLLGITYKEPTLILMEKVKVTRYTIGPGEIYTKIKVLGVDEKPRTRDNIAAIRARLIEKMAHEGNGQAKT